MYKLTDYLRLLNIECQTTICYNWRNIHAIFTILLKLMWFNSPSPTDKHHLKWLQRSLKNAENLTQTFTVTKHLEL